MSAPLQDRYLSAVPRWERSVTIVTPEGTALSFGVARAGDRVAALVVDAAAIVGLLLMIGLAMGLMSVALGGAFDLVGAMAVFFFFVVRVFYFTWFEIRRNGVTPGKRRLRLRVMDVGGGPLRSEAVLTRNFMRELELWLPIQFLLSAEQQLGVDSGWMLMLGSLWVIGLVLFPLFNHDRRRVGDFIAGTMVVVLPEASLRSDMGRKTRGVGVAAAADATYSFTHEMLGVYGIFELEVLEDVLRKRGRGRREAVATVAERIQGKIGWPPTQRVADPERFLKDFYRAQREHLEHRMLLGKRKERKQGQDGPPDRPRPSP